MKVTIKGIAGKYAIGECGVVDLESYKEREKDVDNKSYPRFDKRELFWTIYDQIILPTRERMGVDIDDTFRLLYIEDAEDSLVFHYNIDNYDESYCRVQRAAEMSLEDVVSALYNDLLSTAKSLPDDEPLKKAITRDKSRSVDVPDIFLERLKRDVFYSSWDIDNLEE